MAGSIGTRNESSLHRSLKFRYAGEGGQTEKEVGGWVCDVVSGDGDCIEVQTGSFGPLKRKVPALAAEKPVRIIHPVFISRHIETRDGQGVLLRRRKSPKRGSPWDLFDALRYAPELPLLPNVSIEVVLLDVCEKRVADGRGSWRRRGVSIADREILAWHGCIPLREIRDYLVFLPFSAGEEFTSRDLAERAGIGDENARRCLYVLARLGLVTGAGKRGRRLLYRLGPRGVKGAAKKSAGTGKNTDTGKKGKK